MPETRVPGRSLVTRRALVDIIRPAVAGSYGVIGLADAGFPRRVLRAFGLVKPGIRVALDDGIAIDLQLSVAYGLPVAEVARQADSAVRYAIRRATGREVTRLTVHVAGLRFQTRHEPPPGPSGQSAVAPIGDRATAAQSSAPRIGHRDSASSKGATPDAPGAPDGSANAARNRGATDGSVASDAGITTVSTEQPTVGSQLRR